MCENVIRSSRQAVYKGDQNTNTLRTNELPTLCSTYGTPCIVLWKYCIQPGKLVHLAA